MATAPNLASSESFWHDDFTIPARSPLTSDMTADVCVVGAGIAGLTIAYLLANTGRSVVVLDDGRVGGGETGHTTAHLVNALDERFSELEHLHGTDGARRAAESHTGAIDTIEAIVTAEHIECGFERLDGYLFHRPGEGRTELERELAAAHRAGLSDVAWLDHVSFGTVDVGPGLRFPRQAQLHPLRYLAGLCKAIERLQGRVFTGTRAETFEDAPHPCVHTTHGPVVRSSAIVVATNTPVNDRFAVHTKQSAYRTYVIGLRVRKGTMTRALYWDTGNPYHYVRLANADSTHDLLIVGGEDHKTGQADDTEQRFSRLEAWTRERIPTAGARAYSWSGQVMEPIDGLAFIGRNLGDRHTYVATGDSGNGMTHGTIAGMLITDLVEGRDNPWASLYDPGRVTLRTLGRFAVENLNVAAQYIALATGGDVSSAADVTPGSGAILRRGMRKLAVYRDPSGELHQLSAVCPHLGCIVAWNATEQSWDCPCHGSRFTAVGEVVNGPALSNLPPAD